MQAPPGRHGCLAAGLGLSCLPAQPARQSTARGTAGETFRPARPPPRCPSEELRCWGRVELPQGWGFGGQRPRRAEPRQRW